MPGDTRLSTTVASIDQPAHVQKTGSPCTQPELLDWLAAKLIENGWKLKPMHKLILSSRAWQQSSARDAKKEAADPANGLFMRFVPYRLEGEAIRDSMLAVSGVLDPTMHGPGTRDENSKRRSIYFNIKRSTLPCERVQRIGPSSCQQRRHGQ